MAIITILQGLQGPRGKSGRNGETGRQVRTCYSFAVTNFLSQILISLTFQGLPGEGGRPGRPGREVSNISCPLLIDLRKVYRRIRLIILQLFST